MKDRITAREYQSWQRYRLVAGPFGAERNDYNTALIVKTLQEVINTIIAVNSDKNNNLQSPKLEECLLKFKVIFDNLDYQNDNEVNNVKALIARHSR